MDIKKKRKKFKNLEYRENKESSTGKNKEYNKWRILSQK